MEVKLLNECGYKEALLGLTLSFYDHSEPLETWWSEAKQERASKRALALAFRGGGHNKFLESIQVWVYVQATRGFWSEFDTYRVGMTKNSSSTMHTLDKREVTKEDFSIRTSTRSIDAFNSCLHDYKDFGNEFYHDIAFLKDNLPEGWLQERQLCFNYMTLQNIVNQREKHRLTYWKEFCSSILQQVEHPELLKQPEILI
jgi:hypothetical protein